jgi:hypothetical protein
MPPRLHSRFTFCTAQKDAAGRLFLSARAPYRFTQLPDTRFHIVGQGDTLHSLSARYFRSLPRPAGFWWVIADFQETPIFDPTLTLTPGTIIAIPSEQVLLSVILSEDRRSLTVA